MSTTYNFSAGPGILPKDVLLKAQKELVDYKGSGISVMEMSHRSAPYQEIFDNAMNALRRLMNIPTNYKILFLQGGASSQFAMIPLNLIGIHGQADYVNTGVWAEKAINEAKRYGPVKVVASSEDQRYNYIPALTISNCSPNASYVHITTNNTIYGTRFNRIPDFGPTPLVGDMSSNILSEEYDVSKFGIIYAGAQKNMGPAGLTVVIIRDDLVGHALDITPTMMNYEPHVKNNSMFNTPPCYSIYMAGLVYAWLEQKGGVKAIQEINERKANHFYNFLDESKLFKATVSGIHRSTMNIPFITGDDVLDTKFVSEAEHNGFISLKGHRLVGGMRASFYNAMPEQGVLDLIDFMHAFEKANA